MKIYNRAQPNCQFPPQSEKLDGDEHSDSGARRREKALRPRWRRVEGEKRKGRNLQFSTALVGVAGSAQLPPLTSGLENWGLRENG